MSELNGKYYALSVSEVAARLRVTDRTVRRWVASGKIEHIKIGNRLKFDQSDIENFWPGQHQTPAISQAIAALQAITETTDHEQAMAIAHEALTQLEKWT